MSAFKYLILFAAAVLFCSDINPGSRYVPIFMIRDEMEKAVKLEVARPLKDPGKIYYKKPYLFIVEKYKGVHIFDNTNPTDPENVAFIHVDGIRDIAMKDDVMFADNAVDLIAIQFNPEYTLIQVTKRLKNYFQEMPSPDGYSSTYLYSKRPNNSVLVAWKTN